MKQPVINETQKPLKFLVVGEVASAFRVSNNTVYRLIERHELPSFKVGGQIRIPREGVEDYVRKQLQ
jgi:excisionase family DNA binding protein